MKKIIAVLCVVFLAVCLVQAQEDDDAKDSVSRFSIGAGFTYAGSPDSHNFYGGHLDFGITLYRKALFVQNRFMLRAGGLIIDDVDFSLFTISERLIVGRGDEVAFYIYLEGGAGIYGNESKGSFDDPPAYTFGFGGGFNLGDTEFGGMYFELGYLGHKLEPKTPLAGVIVQAGYRIFF
jgi:hypothetical protein